MFHLFWNVVYCKQMIDISLFDFYTSPVKRPDIAKHKGSVSPTLWLRVKPYIIPIVIITSVLLGYHE